MKTEAMHIGIHCFEYPPSNHGGIGSFSKDLAEGLVREGHEVTVFGIYFENILALSEVVEETINGVKVYRYPFPKTGLSKNLDVFYSRYQLFNIVRKLHAAKPFDVIETPENAGWFPMGLPHRIPMITRLHGGTTYFAAELNRKSSRRNAYFEKWQLSRSDHIVSVSKYTAERTLDIFDLHHKPYSVIYNSVQLTDDLRCNDAGYDKNLIVFSGSVLPKKGVEELMKAMNVICRVIPDAKVVIAGKNILTKNGQPYEVYLSELVEVPYRENVMFTGPLNREKELFPLLCRAHVCCYPSHSEAFAIAPLEAMALEKAVVYSIRSSGAEALEHGISGLLCDPTRPEDIAEKILQVLQDDALRGSLASKGRERVEKLFNYATWLKDNVDLFAKMSKQSETEAGK